MIRLTTRILSSYFNIKISKTRKQEAAIGKSSQPLTSIIKRPSHLKGKAAEILLEKSKIKAGRTNNFLQVEVLAKNTIRGILAVKRRYLMQTSIICSKTC